MKVHARWIAAALSGAAALPAPLDAQQPATEAEAIARDAYVYGYPLVSTYVTKQVMTNVASPQPNGHAPLNQFGSLSQFPTAAFRTVTAPNVNTLYTTAFLDLGREPILVRVPNTNGRYYVMEVLDGWTNVFASPGSRTTGTGEQLIAFVGPRWSGDLPGNVTSWYRSPTDMAWIINRIQTNGPQDYPAVNALQRQITAMPLSAYGRSYMPPMGRVDPAIDTKTPPRTQVNNMPAQAYFALLGRLLETNPPAPADSQIIARMASIGLVSPAVAMRVRRPDASGRVQVVGGDVELRRGVNMDMALARGAQLGLMQIVSAVRTAGTKVNGWQLFNNCGRYGTNYVERAAVTYAGLGCNLPEDAIYPTTMVDSEGRTLNGAHRYVLRFGKDSLPPVEAFWSTTMYDKDFFLVPNTLNRSAISSWMDLKKNADSSVTIYVQKQSPGAARESNWLPAPDGDFVLMLRMYQPEPAVISGQWKPPAVKRVE